MRSVNVSTDVYAAIWAARRGGENDEDAILARVLGCKLPAKAEDHHATRYETRAGVFDARNNVRFAEGFEIFRNYKGRRYEAVANGGMWCRKDTGQTYATLNQLNSSIARGAENVWNGNWKFLDAEGSEKSIATLRSAS
jgi:hypothetical protein